MTTSKPEFRVGDEVIVEWASMGRYHQPQPSRHRIVKVARKYFYIDADEYGQQVGFDLETGWNGKHRQKPRDPNFTNYLACASTPEQFEESQQREELINKINDLQLVRLRGKNEFGDGTVRMFSTARLMELLILLEGVAADNAVANLDVYNT